MEHCPLGGGEEPKIKKPLPTRIQAQVPTNTKPTQATEPTSDTEGRNQKEEGI